MESGTEKIEPFVVCSNWSRNQGNWDLNQGETVHISKTISFTNKPSPSHWIRYRALKRLKIQAYRATLLQKVSAPVSAHRLIIERLWPPSSPDQSPPNFFLWGLLKNSVYCEPVPSIAELKTCIMEVINAIMPNTLQIVSRNIHKRAPDM